MHTHRCTPRDKILCAPQKKNEKDMACMGAAYVRDQKMSFVGNNRGRSGVENLQKEGKRK